MKNLSWFLIIPFLWLTPTSIYNIQFKKLNGGNVQMSEFTNKKIIIIPFNAANPELTRLHYLDSLQSIDASLQIIAVPATDFSGEGNNGALNTLSNSLSSKFVMTKQSAVKKEATIYQHVLFKWLTHVSENNHFDLDAAGVGQIFIVSQSGHLYSVLQNNVPNDILIQALNQAVNQ
jgi:glutathione peroxidase-family protein